MNTQAIVALEKTMTPQIRSGYIEDTLLDPHAANNSVPGQYSVAGGLLGAVAKALIHRYQRRPTIRPCSFLGGRCRAGLLSAHAGIP